MARSSCLVSRATANPCLAHASLALAAPPACADASYCQAGALPTGCTGPAGCLILQGCVEAAKAHAATRRPGQPEDLL